MRPKDEPVHAVEEPPDRQAQGTTPPTLNRAFVDGFSELFDVVSALLVASR
jgi:hypothetical protein